MLNGSFRGCLPLSVAWTNTGWGVLRALSPGSCLARYRILIIWNILALALVCGGCGQETEFDDKPPKVTITHPDDGAQLESTTVIMAEATDDRGIRSVAFYVNDILLGEDVEPPFEHVWHIDYWVDVETLVLTALATDRAIKQTTSPPINVSIVPSWSLAPQLVAPPDSTTMPSGNVEIAWHQHPLAHLYEVQLSAYQEFLPVLSSTLTSDSSLSIWELGGFFWRTRAFDVDSKPTRWSEIWSYCNTPVFAVTCGVERWDHAYEIQPTVDGEYVVAGVNSSLNPGAGYQAWLFKLDAQGEELWSYTYDQLARAKLFAVVESPDGGCICAGHTYENDSSYGWVFKTGRQGSIAWQKIFTDGHYMGFYDLCLTQNDDIAIVGQYFSLDYSEYTRCLILLDANGDPRWRQDYDPGDYDFGPLVKAPDGGFVLLTQRSLEVLKTDPFGEVEWTRQFHNDQHTNRASGIHESADGGYIIVGYVWETDVDKILLLKLDPQGNREWERTYEPDGRGLSVVQTDDGGFAVTGYLQTSQDTLRQAFLLKIDPAGEIIWTRTYSLSGCPSSGHSIKLCQDGGFIIAGEISQDTGVWILKTDAWGHIMYSDVNTGDAVLWATN